MTRKKFPFEPGTRIGERLAYFDRARPNRKYDKGMYPCGECRGGNHIACRPRMDWTPCTCSCARADEQRLTLEAAREGDKAMGVPERTNEEIFKVYGIRKRKVYSKK